MRAGVWGEGEGCGVRMRAGVGVRVRAGVGVRVAIASHTFNLHLHP